MPALDQARSGAVRLPRSACDFTSEIAPPAGDAALRAFWRIGHERIAQSRPSALQLRRTRQRVTAGRKNRARNTVSPSTPSQGAIARLNAAIPPETATATGIKRTPRSHSGCARSAAVRRIMAAAMSSLNPPERLYAYNRLGWAATNAPSDLSPTGTRIEPRSANTASATMGAANATSGW